MKISPCKECDVRYLACHDSCNKYKDWKEELRLGKVEISNGRKVLNSTFYYSSNGYTNKRNDKRVLY